MAKISDERQILRHGPIEYFAENLWCVTRSLPGMGL